MYSATINLTITTFNPIGSGGIQATFALNAPPDPAKQVAVSLTPPSSLLVNVVPTYTGLVQLVYQISDPAYILLGIAMNPNDPNASRGRKEFPVVTIQRDPAGSQMAVTDSCSQENVDFKYVVLVQQVSDGSIGLIDPDIDNENNE